MINFLTIALFSILFHAHHISICEINYKKEEKSLQIIQQVFADDLETYLKKQTNDPHFDVSVKNEKTNEVIKQFAVQHFKLNLDENSKQFEWIGYKLIGNDIKLFFEFKDVVGEKITISNSIFLDMLGGQQNVVHLMVGNIKKTKVCDKKKPTISFNLN